MLYGRWSNVSLIPSHQVLIRCLPFDGIGARHSGMTHDDAGRSLDATCKHRQHVPVPADQEYMRPCRPKIEWEIPVRCRAAGPQYIIPSKVNNGSEPYSVGNDLSKRGPLESQFRAFGGRVSLFPQDKGNPEETIGNELRCIHVCMVTSLLTVTQPLVRWICAYGPPPTAVRRTINLYPLWSDFSPSLSVPVSAPHA